MKLSHRQVLALIGVIAMLVAGPILLYRIRPVVGIAAAFGLGATVLIVLAHVGVVAAVIAPLLHGADGLGVSTVDTVLTQNSVTVSAMRTDVRQYAWRCDQLRCTAVSRTAIRPSAI